MMNNTSFLINVSLLQKMANECLHQYSSQKFHTILSSTVLTLASFSFANLLNCANESLAEVFRDVDAVGEGTALCASEDQELRFLGVGFGLLNDPLPDDLGVSCADDGFFS